MLIRKFVFLSEKNMPLKFGYEHMATEIPYITFQKKGWQDNGLFIEKNPILEELFRTDDDNHNLENSFTLEQLTKHESTLMPYIDYIWAAVELYAYLWLDGNITVNIDWMIRNVIHTCNICSQE